MHAIAYKGGGKSLILAIFVRTYYVDHPLWERQFFSIETFKQNVWRSFTNLFNPLIELKNIHWKHQIKKQV